MEADLSTVVETLAPLKVTPNLIRLERDGNLLLANSLHLKPLLVRRGRDFIDKLINVVSEERLSRSDLVDLWPGETAIIDILLSHRILVVTTEDETAPRSVGLAGAGEKSPGLSLYLLLSQDCNLGCVYCLNGIRTYRKNDRPMMSEETAFRAVDRFAATIRPGGYIEIAMFGGEPLLNWELAKKTIDYAETVSRPKHPDIQFRYHVTSNLSFLPEDFIDRVKTHGITVLCDIDGPGIIHDACRPFRGGSSSHGPIAGNVRRLIEAGIPVSLRTTVTALNVEYMEETARHHRELGGTGSAFVPVSIVNSDEDIIPDKYIPDIGRMLECLTKVQKSGIWGLDRLFPFSTYRAKLKPGNYTVLGCGAPYGNTPVVDVNGDVYPCIYLVGIKRYHQGNLMDGSYPDNTVLARMAEELHVDRREDCKECAWRYLCGGACPVQLLTMANRGDISPKAREYSDRVNCEYTKKVLEILLWEAAEQAARTADGVASPPATAAGHELKYC